MPCDRIITQSVDLTKCGDAELLKKALLCVCTMEYGRYYHVPTRTYVDVVGGVVTGNKNTIGVIADEIKRAYSKQVILKTAKLQGWRVKDLGNNKLQVVKARY
jgi:hypothetical protein